MLNFARSFSREALWVGFNFALGPGTELDPGDRESAVSGNRDSLVAVGISGSGIVAPSHGGFVGTPASIGVLRPLGSSR